MNRKRTAEECFAKAEAYLSCAGHMELNWTDDQLERKAGDQLQKTFYARVEHWRNLGKKRKLPNVKVRG